MTNCAKEVILELRDRLADRPNYSLHVPSGVEIVPEALSSVTVKEKVSQLKRCLKMEKRKTLMLTCCLVTSWMVFFTFCTIVVLMEWSRRWGYISDRVDWLH